MTIAEALDALIAAAERAGLDDVLHPDHAAREKRG